MEKTNIKKKLKSLLNYKSLEFDLLTFTDSEIINFIENLIFENEKNIDLEIFHFSGGKLNNIEEYFEEYKNSEMKPMNSKILNLLMDNSLLQKIKNEI